MTRSFVSRYFLLAFFSVVFTIVVKAEYPVSAIPQAMLKKANVVKRLDETRIEVRSIGKAVYRRHYVYTILNENGDDEAAFVVGYDRFRSINDISGNLYNAEGKKIKSVKRKDIQDGSMVDGMSLITDGKYKYHNFYCREYPYTVEYEMETEMNGIFYFREWIPQDGPQVAVENSKLIFSVPKDYALRYKMFHYNGTPVITEGKNSKELTWELKGVPAKKEETDAPEWNKLVTRVLTAPSEFEIGGYKGNMDSWQSFGRFMSALYAGRDVLPAATKAKVQELTKDLKTDWEKINVLYRWMQQNTRYISIQLGMGGWQPLEATYVAEKKYGDCKALSNYMVAVLREAGVKANPVLITGGSEDKDLISDFPSNQFNHVVVCVPGAKDSVWLECTSQTVEPGYMGSFTGDREALLIDDANSKVVRTPAYKKQQNVQNRIINAVLDDKGTLRATVNTKSTGLLQDGLHGIVHNLSDEEKQKRLRSGFTLPNYDVPLFTYKETGEQNNVPVIEENLQLVSRDYASFTGKRLFITPNILSRSNIKLEDNERENPIDFDYGYIYTDSFSIKIPEGYTVEAMPKPVAMENAFGMYKIQVSYKDGVINLTRFYERNDGTYPAADYKKMVDFFDAIYAADRARMVFVKE